MPRTPKQIAEYIDYYKDKPKAEREWAFRNLAEIEGKPIEALKELAERYRDNVGGRSKWITDDIKEQIKQAVRAGVSNLDIIANFGVSHNTVTRIKNAMRDAGEVLPETRGRRPREEQPAEKQPEAYPGQINDDEPEIEDDVKAYIPHETEIAGDCNTEPKPKKSLGESLSDLGAAFCSIFGVAPTEIETELDTESVDFIKLLVDLVTFARDKIGEDITLEHIECGNDKRTAEIVFGKDGRTYRAGVYEKQEEDEE